MAAKTNPAAAQAISQTVMAEAQSFAIIQTAQAKQLQTETAAFARAALFTNQIPSYEASPAIYKRRAYLQAFPDATKNSRKYVMLVTNTQDVLIFDLKDAIRDDLMNLNVPNDK